MSWFTSCSRGLKRRRAESCSLEPRKPGHNENQERQRGARFRRAPGISVRWSRARRFSDRPVVQRRGAGPRRPRLEGATRVRSREGSESVATGRTPRSFPSASTWQQGSLMGVRIAATSVCGERSVPSANALGRGEGSSIVSVPASCDPFQFQPHPPNSTTMTLPPRRLVGRRKRFVTQQPWARAARLFRRVRGEIG